MRQLCFVSILAAITAHAHHSDAGLNLDGQVSIDGVVTDFSWRNPHVYFIVRTTEPNGVETDWTVQMASVATVSRMGWSQGSLAVGDRVTVGAYPARDGRHYAKFLSIERHGGADLPTSFDSSGEVRLASPVVSANTSTIAGRWMADPATLEAYPGRIDGLTRALLELTPAGRAGLESYDENSTENPELRCIGRPTPAMLVYTDIYPLEIEIDEAARTAFIRSQFMDQERIIHLDGRSHPDAASRSHEGHSVGSWEGETFVVDTTNFADHRSPYQNGIPSGARKHVVERYTLSDDGTRLHVEFTLEDPDFIVGAMTHARDLVYTPAADMSPFNCDLESTRRFLPD
ncbi:MAG TPA: DUF6152 family protein [Gammaproteobacteria bacterium]|nr:DUF6152 family protein [Gammaproteobacteria bacterium]